jgi:hypothetical protein
LIENPFGQGIVQVCTCGKRLCRNPETRPYANSTSSRMNFKYMPELDLHWAYPALLAVMAVIVISMLVSSGSRNGCEPDHLPMILNLYYSDFPADIVSERIQSLSQKEFALGSPMHIGLRMSEDTVSADLR